MSASTSIYGFPYLEPADPPDIAGATRGLAEAVEAVRLGRRALVGKGSLSSFYTLTNTQTDLAGTTVTINVPTGAAVYFAGWKMAAQLITAGNITAVCQLLVDGVAQTQQAIWNPGNIAGGSARGGGSQHAAGALSGSGNHVFKLQAARAFPSGSSGDIRLDDIHTHLSVLVIPL